MTPVTNPERAPANAAKAGPKAHPVCQPVSIINLRHRTDKSVHDRNPVMAPVGKVKRAIYSAAEGLSVNSAVILPKNPPIRAPTMPTIKLITILFLFRIILTPVAIIRGS